MVVTVPGAPWREQDLLPAGERSIAWFMARPMPTAPVAIWIRIGNVGIVNGSPIVNCIQQETWFGQPWYRQWRRQGQERFPAVFDVFPVSGGFMAETTSFSAVLRISMWSLAKMSSGKSSANGNGILFSKYRCDVTSA